MAKKTKEKKVTEKEVNITLDESTITGTDFIPVETMDSESVKEVTNVVNEEVEVIGFDNKPVSLLAKGDDKAPKGFVPVFEKTKVGKFGCYNGRTFQVLNKETGLWCDNGKQFLLSEIK